jgi:hypothetical protein
VNLNNPPLKEEWGSVGWQTWFTNLLSYITFGQFWSVRTVTTDYTCTKYDSVVLLNADATVTLPSVRTGEQKRITVKVTNAGGGTRTVAGNGVNIDGASSVTTTTQYTSWDFVTDGTNWFIV